MKIICNNIHFIKRYMDKSKYAGVYLLFILLFFMCQSGCNWSFLSTPTPVPTESKIMKWFDKLDAARKEGKNSQKLLLINFYTTWSGWSKKMDKETYTYYKVVNLSENFICVRLDLDKYPDLEKKYNISGNPTVIFEDPITGKEVGRIEGIRERQEMSDELTKMLSYKVKTEGGGK